MLTCDQAFFFFKGGHKGIIGRGHDLRLERCVTLASWVFSQLPKCIHNSIYAQLKA